MLLIINILLFEYGMALSCDCVLTVLNLSAEKCAPTETNRVTDETFQFFFSTKRNVLSAELKTRPCFLLANPRYTHPPEEGDAVQTRERKKKFYICNRGDCFVCTTWF